MLEEDFANKALFIIGVAAVVSPAITAIVTGILNHWHEWRMKKLEYKRSDKLQREAHEREIYEGYIRATGAYIQCKTDETAKSFGEHSALFAYYVPKAIRKEVSELERYMDLTYDDVKSTQEAQLSSIIIKLRELNKLP